MPEEVRLLVQEISTGRLQRWIAFPALAAFGAIGLLRRPRRPLSPDPALLGLLAAGALWAVLSLAWADDAPFALRRLAVAAMLVLGASALARHFSLGEIFALGAGCSLLYLAAGVAAESALGTWAPLRPGYRFAGTLHPNQQGIGCAILLLGALALARQPGRRAAGIALALVALMALALTGSRTAFAAALAASGLYLGLVAPPARQVGLVLGSAWAVGAAALLHANRLLPAPWSVLLLGRDPSGLGTLTGRTDIWAFGLRHAAQRPLTGHGFNSFWSPDRAAEVSRVVQWKISEGHSAYLDTLLNLGAVGLAILVTTLLVALVGARARHRAGRDPGHALAAALLVFALLDGVLESAMVIPNFLSFLLAAVLLHLALHRSAEPFREAAA